LYPTGVFNIYDDLSAPPDPTGVTDSSAAFYYAINEAAMAGGGIVFVPPGNYMTAFTIGLPSNVQLVGSDQGDTSIMAGNSLRWAEGRGITTVLVTNANNIPGATSSGAQCNVGVRDITLNGNATNQPGLKVGHSGAIVEFELCTRVTIQRCRIYNCQNHAIAVDYYDNEVSTLVNGDIRILDNTIDIMATARDNDGAATGSLSIRVTGYYNVIVRNNVIGYNPVGTWKALWANDGIDVLHCDDIQVIGNQITYVTDGIGVDSGFTCVIADNIVENYQGYGIRSEVVQLGSSAITRLVIANNVVTAALAGSKFTSKACIVAAAGLPFDGSSGSPTSNHYAVTKNVVKGPTSQGIISCGASNGTCIGNSVDLNTTDEGTYGQQFGIYVKGRYVSVRGNEVFDSSSAASTGVGIELISDTANSILPSQTAIGIVVDSNTVTEMLVGIWLHTNLQDVSVTDNNVVGNVTAIELPTTHTIADLRVAGNLGHNPPSPSVIAQPTIMATPQTNVFSYDCSVSVAGSALTSITLDSVSLPWPPTGVTVTGPITVDVPVNAKIKVTGTGATWYWTPQ